MTDGQTDVKALKFHEAQTTADVFVNWVRKHMGIMEGIYDYEGFASLPLKKPPMIMQGLLHERQNVIFSGPFGIGKTMFAIPLSMCLATGKQFLGRTILRPYRTAVIDLENDAGEIQSRLIKQKEGLNLSPREEAILNKHWVYTNATTKDSPFYGKDLATATGRAALDAFLDLVKAEVLLIDNLGRAYGELDDTESVHTFYKELARLREKHPSLKTMLFLHHIVKMPKTRGAEAPYSLLQNPYEYLALVRGSGRLMDYAETRLAISKEKIGSEEWCVINGINRSGRVTPVVLRLNEQSLIFEVGEQDAVQVESGFQKRPRQRELFMQTPPRFRFTDIKEIRDSRGKTFSKTTISDMLKNGMDNGLLNRDPSGVYSKRGEEGSPVEQ